MKSSLISLLILFPSVLLFGQAEHETHLATIRAAHPGDSAFVEYVIHRVLEGPQDVMFVTNRELLDGLCVKHCAPEEVSIYDTLKDGRFVDILLKTTPFDTNTHQYSYFTGTDSIIELIDSLPAYGAGDGIPVTQIDTLIVKVDEKELIIPADAYSDLFNANFCQDELFQKAAMAYPSQSGDYLYLYLYGGKGSGLYLAKLIFDDQQYIKKIVTEYADFSQFDVFRWGFLGY